jgi:hypothetical protein
MHTATRGLRWGRRAQDTARSLRTVAASRCGPTIRRHEYFAFATSRCACRCGAVLSNDSNLRRRRSRWARWALRPRVTFWARRTSGTLITLWSGLRVAAAATPSVSPTMIVKMSGRISRVHRVGPAPRAVQGSLRSDYSCLACITDRTLSTYVGVSTGNPMKAPPRVNSWSLASLATALQLLVT